MRHPTRLRGNPSEAGETLIEVLIASALMALVVVAVIGGIATMLLGSRVHREQTDANTALVAAMEQLKSAATARACTYSGLPPRVTIQKIQYEVNATDANGNPIVDFVDDPNLDGDSNPLTCDLTGPLTLQRITVQYTTPDNRVTPTLSFIKGLY